MYRWIVLALLTPAVAHAESAPPPPAVAPDAMPPQVAPRRQQQQPDAAFPSGGGPVALPPPVPVPARPVPWIAEAGAFEPDVYSSPRVAARALGARWAKQAAAPGSTPPAKVLVKGVPHELRAELAEGVRARLPGVEVRYDLNPALDGPEPACSEARAVFEMSPPRGQPAIRRDSEGDGGPSVVISDLDHKGGRLVVRTGRPPQIDVRPDREPGEAPEANGGGHDGEDRGADRLPAQEPGRMSLSATRGVTTASASVRFVDKPWVDDFAAFTSTHEGRWVVGRSKVTAVSPAEAANDARWQAADEMVSIVRSQFPEWQRRPDHVRAPRGLRDLIYARLQNDDSVADRFAQKFDRPYGTTWSEAVLIDASPERVASLAQVAIGEEAARRHAFLGAAALMLVTFVLYKLVNAYTRGYFTWSLRTAALAAVAAGVVLLMMIA